MKKDISAKIKTLVADNRLDEALDLLLENSNDQERQHTIILLKGQLDLLREQELADTLSFDDLSRAKRKIAQAILQMTSGDTVPIRQTDPASARTGPVPSGGSHFPKGAKYALFASLALVGLFLLYKVTIGTNPASQVNDGRNTETENTKTEQPTPDRPDTDGQNKRPDPSTSDKPLLVQNFPRLEQPFNFLDFRVEFRWAEAEWISDTEIRLKIRCYLTCKSNLGVCYRAGVRLYADDRPLAPADQSNLDGWVAHEATITDDISFVLPADTKTFEIELSRDKSTWRRPFQILMGK